jgi:hypothetical protein
MRAKLSGLNFYAFLKITILFAQKVSPTRKAKLSTERKNSENGSIFIGKS